MVAESYFKNPLLAKWEQALDASIHARYLRGFSPDVSPIDVLAYCRDGAPAETYDQLRALILAELSGARRAREKAEAIDAEPVSTIGQRSGRLIHSARRIVAREILEAFDGE